MFVLPDIFFVKYPAGGYNIIYNISAHLASQGYKVAIKSLKLNPRTFTEKYLSPILMHNNKLLIILSKLIGSDYKYTILKNIEISFDYKPFYTKKIFACSYHCAKYVSNYKNALNRYIILQNDEADPLFSGKIDALKAKKAYNYKNLKKIVICEELERRYNVDKPFRFQVYVDDFFKSYIHPMRRNKYTIFIPLRIEKSKGSIYALRAVKLLKSGKNGSKYKFIAFGNVPPNSVPSYIEYHFKPTNKKLVNLYNRAAIFISPSLIEGFSSVPSQAMACGCATIVFDSGGIHEFAINNYNSIIVPIKNSREIVEKVEKLVSNDLFRVNIAKRGIKTIKKKFTLNNMFKKWDMMELT